MEVGRGSRSIPGRTRNLIQDKQFDRVVLALFPRRTLEGILDNFECGQFGREWSETEACGLHAWRECDQYLYLMRTMSMFDRLLWHYASSTLPYYTTLTLST